MTSVMMNTNGHTSTPAVKLSVPSMPNNDQLKGWAPMVASSAKILTPTNSPISALVRKKPARKMNSRLARRSVVRTMASVATAQPAQFTPGMFVGPLGAARCERSCEPTLLGKLLARRAGSIGLGITGLGERCRAAAIRQLQHLALELEARPRDRYRVADAHGMRRFDATPVDMDLATACCLGRQRARLEQARTP